MPHHDERTAQHRPVHGRRTRRRWQCRSCRASSRGSDRRLAAIGGVEANAIGGVEASAKDAGVSATLTDANRALICAVQIQRSFEDWGSSKTAPVRVGISRDDEDAVAVAAEAGSGEIFVTESVRALAEPRGHLFTARSELQLSGVAVPLFAVRWWEHD